MLGRTLVRAYDSPADAATTWAYVSDPVAVAEASSHAKVVRAMPPLTVGAEWDEHHLEDDCDFDSLRWRCTALVPGRSLTVEGLQSGARQRVMSTLMDRDGEDGGVQVMTHLTITPSLRAPGRIGERLLLPALLRTPLGARLLAEGLDEAVEDDRRALAALAR